jgi:hypothetical protein
MHAHPGTQVRIEGGGRAKTERTGGVARARRAIAICSLCAFGPSTTLRAQESLPVVFTGHVLFPAQVRNEPGWLLLDPVRGVLLDEDWARRQRVPLLDGVAAGLGRRLFVGGAGANRHEAFFARDVKVRIGRSRSSTLRTVAPLNRTMAESVGYHVTGFAGLDAFGDAIVEVAVARRRLRLHDRARASVPPDAVAVPVTWDGGIRPLITLQLGLPNGESVAVRAYVDLGMAGALRLTTRFVDARRLVPLLCETRAPAAVTHDERGLGGVLTSVRTRFPWLAIPGVAELSDVAATLARETEGADAAPGWDALVGWELLRRFDLWFDQVGARLWMRPNGAVGDRFGSADVGLRLRPLRSPDEPLVVASVSRRGTAERAGLRAGDQIVTIDGAPVGGADVGGVRRTLQLEDPQPRRLGVRRDGSLLTVSLQPSDSMRAGGACAVP